MTIHHQTITIEKIVPGGYGIGRRQDGMVVFVRHVLPGEKVRVRPTRQKKNHVLAQLEQVLEPSAHRCHPVCKLYTRCGGCDLQHAEAAYQLTIKEGILRESMIRGGANSDLTAPTLNPILPSPKSFNYRQRILLHIDDAGRPGFCRPQSHEIVPVETCLLARPEINTVWGNLRTAPAAEKLFRIARSVELLFNPGSNKVIVLFNAIRKPRPADRILVETLLKEIQGIDQILFQVAGHGFFGPGGKYKRPFLPPYLKLTLPPAATGGDELVLTWEAGGFCQVNLEQNHSLISMALSLARPGPKDKVLDLYCGMGNFSLPLSLHAAEVTGIEGQGSAIRSAKRNVQPSVLNCHFQKQSVPAGIRQLIKEGKQFDLIVLDPPRQGAIEIIDKLSVLGADRLLYISCDPATFIRDLVGLERIGYSVSQVQPIDIFPQTHHLETVSLLERR
jgi:23S rRNA (uracil1939-C5)-methyltransferase